MNDCSSNTGAETQGFPGTVAQERFRSVERSEHETVLRLLQGLVTAIAIILLLASLSKAHGESYTFHNYQKPDGLENPNIHCLFQDHAGLLWMCTDNGLYSTDGGRITRVPTFEGRDLPYITDAKEDAAGRLWVSSYHELIYRDGQGLHRPGLPRFGTLKNSQTSIVSFPQEKNQIFFLADEVLYRVYTDNGGSTWHQVPFLSRENLSAHPELNTLDSLVAIDGDKGEPGAHVLWLSCENKLCEVSPDDGSVQVWGTADGVPDDIWQSLFRDHTGRLWARGLKQIISLPKGATRFVPEQQNLNVKSLNMRYPSIAEDAQGRILININNGIARREGNGWHTFGPDNGLPLHPVVNELFDRQGAFWFTVEGHGLEHWLGYDNYESWTARDGLSLGGIWGLDEDRKGTVWISTETGVDKLDSIHDRWHQLDAAHPMRQTQALLVDPRDHIWIGTSSDAVVDFDPRTHAERQVATVPGIYNFFKDPAGSIWICGGKALFRLDPGDGYTRMQSSVHGHPFPSGGFFEIKTAPNGDMYFVGEQGLFQLKANADSGLTHVTLPAGVTLPYNSPFAIAKDGTLWLEGESSPVVHLRIDVSSQGPVAFLLDRISEPLVASPSVYQVSLDHRGWLWVGTDRGLDVYNGSEWVGVSSEDGLIWDDTDSDSFHESPDGSVWIGTSSGVTHIRNPEKIFHHDPFSLLVNGARLGSVPVELGGSTRIPWVNRGALTMALGISNPSRASLVHYRYRLEGSETEWQETDEPIVRYSALPPGRYRLSIVAIDTRRHQESSPVYITFRLMPPWWRTAWFLCGLAVIIAALVGLASWWRVGALIAQQQRLEELVRERTLQLELEKKELIEARMALTEQASRDGLTGLLNRSAIFEVLSNEIQYASEKNTSLAIVLADLDHFKRINDTYGHQIGDAVLRECARRFRLATRPTDYVGRYGGEELLLVMPGLSQDNSMDRLENLRATIAHELFDCEGIGLPVTCSFGVAWLDEHSRGIKPLIALADQALYAAKTRGRNRVETITSASSGLFFPDGSSPLVTI